MNFSGCMYTTQGDLVCQGERNSRSSGVEGFTNNAPCIAPTLKCTPAQIGNWLSKGTKQCCVVENKNVPLYTNFAGGSGQETCTPEVMAKPCTSLGYSAAKLRDMVAVAMNDGMSEKACCKLVI